MHVSSNLREDSGSNEELFMEQSFTERVEAYPELKKHIEAMLDVVENMGGRSDKANDAEIWTLAIFGFKQPRQASIVLPLTPCLEGIFARLGLWLILAKIHAHVKHPAQHGVNQKTSTPLCYTRLIGQPE